VLLLGEFEHTIDSKNRLAVPAEIRDVLSMLELGGGGLIAAPGANEHLWLWPEKTFQELASDLGGSLLGDERMMDFERAVFSQAARCPLDSAGRVRLPERLLSQFGLSGSVMVLGVRNHLELVTPKAWRLQQDALPSTKNIWQQARQAQSDTQVRREEQS